MREPKAPHSSRETPPRWPQRIGWLLLIWVASVAALAAVAWLLKVVMRSVGITI